GVPVIARPVAAILELMTPYDIICSDFTVESLKRGIIQFLSNSTLSPESIENLRRQAEKYRPEDSAEAIIDVYRDALGVFSGAAV
ncbi:MAG: glycosyltransferase, partial [SAR324 cluster bacterium]|nr:glycosyltransferase [SAR324 cluster bacterium]